MLKVGVLKVGAAILQTDNPLEPMHVYLNGFHPMKSNTRNVNLNGIEYIISGKLFEQLPATDKQYWHPHNYEILSGQLVAPGCPTCPKTH